MSRAARAGALGGGIGGGGGGALLLVVVAAVALSRRRTARARVGQYFATRLWAEKNATRLSTALSNIPSSAGGWRASEVPAREVVLGALLGAGGFGAVYRGRWRGSDVAVKVFDPSLSASAQQSAQGTGGSRSSIEPIPRTTSALLSKLLGSSGLRPGRMRSSQQSFAVEVALLGQLRRACEAPLL